MVQGMPKERGKSDFCNESVASDDVISRCITCHVCLYHEFRERFEYESDLGEGSEECEIDVEGGLVTARLVKSPRPM